MRLVRTLFGRSGVIGLLSDLAMVAAAGVRLTRRRGAGATAGPASGRDQGELLLAAAAGWRLLRRLRRRRRTRRARRLASTD